MSNPKLLHVPQAVPVNFRRNGPRYVCPAQIVNWTVHCEKCENLKITSHSGSTVVASVNHLLNTSLSLSLFLLQTTIGAYRWPLRPSCSYLIALKLAAQYVTCMHRITRVEVRTPTHTHTHSSCMSANRSRSSLHSAFIYECAAISLSYTPSLHLSLKQLLLRRL